MSELEKKLPLNSHEDGILIKIDRETGDISVYYDGIAATLEIADYIMAQATDMIVNKIAKRSEVINNKLPESDNLN